MGINAVEGLEPRGSDGLSAQQKRCGVWKDLLHRHRWLGFVLPFGVYMAVGALEPIRPPLKPKPHPMPDQLPAAEQVLEPALNQQNPSADSAQLTEKGSLQAAPADSPSNAPAEKLPPAKQSPPLQSERTNRKPNPPPGEHLLDNPSGLVSDAGHPEAPPASKENQAVLSASPPQAEPLPEANCAGIPYSAYPAVYALKILLTCVAIGLVWPVWRQFPLRVSLLAVLVGMGGWIIWLGFGGLDLERKWLEPIGLGGFLDLGARSGINPFRTFLHQPAWMLWGFIALRLFGMVVVVALVEEFFLRGFLMRYVQQADWWQAPVGSLSLTALIACVVYAVLSHPAELFAASLWFLFVTLLAYKTKNIWDCVLAHATTNALLGAYILLLAEWKYW